MQSFHRTLQNGAALEECKRLWTKCQAQRYLSKISNERQRTETSTHLARGGSREEQRVSALAALPTALRMALGTLQISGGMSSRPRRPHTSWQALQVGQAGGAAGLPQPGLWGELAGGGLGCLARCPWTKHASSGPAEVEGSGSKTQQGSKAWGSRVQRVHKQNILGVPLQVGGEEGRHQVERTLHTGGQGMERGNELQGVARPR